RGFGGRQNDFSDAIGHAVHIRVGLVCLQHGEFRRVRGVDTLVAEDSTNFKNLVDAANYGTLQIQLGSNAKRHRLIKCVQVCLEWTGLSATVDELQDRGFNLDVTLIFQCTAN